MTIFVSENSPLHPSATHDNLAGSKTITEFGGYRQQSSPWYVTAGIPGLADFCADKRFHQSAKLIHCIDGTNKLDKNTKKECITGWPSQGSLHLLKPAAALKMWKYPFSPALVIPSWGSCCYPHLSPIKTDWGSLRTITIQHSFI